MKVSIITPCYNSASYIEDTIASVQSQSITDWEMIVVDDGSTDNSADIIRRIATLDSRVKLIQKENGGSASARNLGLSLAIGEYIQFLDADDALAPYKLERQIAIMEIEELDVSYTDFRMKNMDNSIEEKTIGHTFCLGKLLIGWGPLGTIPPHTFLYRHDFLKRNKITFTQDIREREDWDYHIKVFSSYPKVKRIKGYCGAYYFRCPTGKTTGTSQEKVQLGTFRYLNYKIQHSPIGQRLLLYIRFAIELCYWLLRKIRYNYNSHLLDTNNFCNDHEFKKSLIISAFLSPISIIIVLVCIVKDRI